MIKKKLNELEKEITHIKNQLYNNNDIENLSVHFLKLYNYYCKYCTDDTKLNRVTTNIKPMLKRIKNYITYNITTRYGKIKNSIKNSSINKYNINEMKTQVISLSKLARALENIVKSYKPQEFTKILTKITNDQSELDAKIERFQNEEKKQYIKK